MKINNLGIVELNEKDAMDLLYSGKNLDNAFLEKSISIQFNECVKKNNDPFTQTKSLESISISKTEFDLLNQNNWFMPDEYKTLDIEEYLITICPEQHYNRLNEELTLYRKNNLLDLLRYVKYLVDTLRKNNIVWGVGRGSCVSSYCLFLIGIHKIDPIKYSLDIKDFFK